MNLKNEFAKLSEKNMDDAKAHYNRGSACLSRGDDEQAISEFSEAIRLKPDYEEAYIIRGKAYYYKEVIDRAISDFDEAILLNPNNAEAYYFRGNAYRGKGDYDRAISDFNELIRLDPNDAVAYYFRGIAYSIKGDYNRAISDYDEVMRLNPNDALVYNIRGKAYHRKGNYNRAISDFSEAIRLNPNLAKAHYNRGSAYYDKGYSERAIADYESTLRIDPDYSNARSVLENIKKEGNKTSKLEPGKQRAGKAIVLIWIVLALEIISLIFNYFQYSLLRTIADGGEVSMEMAETSNMIGKIIPIIHLIALIISAVMFIKWFRRVYHNLNKKVTGLLYTENWTIYCWFIPVLHLYKPYQIMKELYCRTEDLLIEEGILSNKCFLPSNSLGSWWILWLTRIFTYNFMFLYSFRAETIGQLMTINLICMTSSILAIPLALITIKIIKDYSRLESLLIEYAFNGGLA